MIRFFIAALLAILSATAGAENKPVPQGPHLPPPHPAAAVASAAFGNPFLPHVQAAAPSAVSLPQPAVPPAALLRDEVQNMFRECGDRIGEINGDTLFRLSLQDGKAQTTANYLFLPTKVEDDLPVIQATCEAAVKALLPKKPKSKAPAGNSKAGPAVTPTTPVHSAPPLRHPMRGGRP